jgi:hypothetical protein
VEAADGRGFGKGQESCCLKAAARKFCTLLRA